MRRLFLGNWKMHKTRGESVRFVEEFLALCPASAQPVADVGFAPPFTSIEAVSSALGVRRKEFLIGAQNVHWDTQGAQTGEISAVMLRDLGVDFAIIGHSERRAQYGETDATVARRARAAIDAGLLAVVCVGETRAEFEAGKTAAVVTAQLEGSLAGLSADDCEHLVIAYEPVWAIGTGLAATPEIAAGVHAQIRKLLSGLFADQGKAVPILYGGSMNGDNIESLLCQPDIAGGLVGGASLKPDSWWGLVSSGRKASA